MSDERRNYITKLLERRAMLKAEADEKAAQIKQIDLELKTLEQQDEPYLFGAYKLFWKKVSETRASMDWIKEHAPATYAKALVTREKDYFCVK